MSNIDQYLEKHIIEYIKHELNTGYSILSIKRALLAKGHHATVIDNAISELKKKEFRPYIVRQRQQTDKLNDDAFNYAVDLVEKYINHQLNLGYDLNEVKHVLANFGHSSEVIESAVNKVRKGTKAEEKHKKQAKTTLMLCVIGLIVVLFAISVLVDEPIYLIIFGFLPAILSLIAIEFFKEYKIYMLLTPAVITALYFLLIVATNLPPLANMDAVQLAVLNLVIGYVFVALYHTDRL